MPTATPTKANPKAGEAMPQKGVAPTPTPKAAVPAPAPAETQGPPNEPLTGQELLNFVQNSQSEGLADKEIAKLAGYYSINKEGNLRVNTATFNRQLLYANGTLKPRPKASRAGLGSSETRARVASTGMLLVPQAAVMKACRIASLEYTAGMIFELQYDEDATDGAIICLPTEEVEPVRKRNCGPREEPGTPLPDQAAA